MARYDYTQRLTSLQKRRIDAVLLEHAFSTRDMRSITESYETLQESSSIKYVIGAMLPVDNKYTQVTLSEGERVKNHLQKLSEHSISVEFRFQGSVTNNTHIKAYSDIDILTILRDFYLIEPPNKPTSPYLGDPIEDLCHLRRNCCEILCTAFPKADVVTSGSKSISLSGGSLKRKVDVVPSSWYNTVMYVNTMLDYYRGVKVLDYHKRVLISNTPFLHNKRIEEKDGLAANNYKKVVRLLKTIKADSDIQISSYDITSLIYHMENRAFLVGYSPLMLVKNTLEYLSTIIQNPSYRAVLKVPDESRLIFQDGGANIENVSKLRQELSYIYQDILESLMLTGTSIEKRIIS